MSQVIVPVASTYTTPSDYNDTGAVWEAIGAGGSGGNGTTNTNGGGGGGGGEYQKVITPGLAANTTYDINIPSGGAGSGVSGTYIKNGAGGGGSIVLEAKNGGNGATPTAGTAGTGGTPNTVGQHFNGGAGGTGGGVNRSGAGGGGSAGNIGVGKDGGTGVAVTTGGGGGGGSNGGSSTAGASNTTLGSDGGAGTGGTGGGTGATSSADATAASAGGGGGSGMATNNHLGSAGAVDTSFDATHGASGGGGSGTRNTGTSGNGRAGGTYGGGGGGAGDSTTTGGTGGAGGAGILVLNYTPAGGSSPSSSISPSPSSSVSLSPSSSVSSSPSSSQSPSSSVSASPSIGTPNTKFLEPGGDADFLVGTTNGFWATNTGSVVVATDFVHGGHIKSLKYAANSVSRVVSNAAVLADAGSRVSFYLYINALPSATNRFFTITTSAASDRIHLYLTSAGILQLFGANTALQMGSNGSTLSTGQWYRICIAYTITSNSVNETRVFLNGVSDITASNFTNLLTGTDNFTVGNNQGNSTLDIRTSDHYVDDSASLTDTGNIWVTAKRPNANGTANNFNIQIGAGGSGYGTGHSPQVNERALSTTNGWSVVNAGSVITEEYNIESASTGDIDISSAAIVDVMGWVSAKALASETASIIVDGASSNISVTSTITMFKKFANSTTYPAGTGTDIGIATDSTATTVSLYEAGVLIAYIPSTGSSPSSSVSSSISPSPSSSVSLSISPSPSSSVSLSPSSSVSSSVSSSPSSSQSPSSSISPSPSSSVSLSPSSSVSLSVSPSPSSSISPSPSSSDSSSPSSSQSPSSSESPSPSPSNAAPEVVKPNAGKPQPRIVHYDGVLRVWTGEVWAKAKASKPMYFWGGYWKSVDSGGEEHIQQ